MKGDTNVGELFPMEDEFTIVGSSNPLIKKVNGPKQI